MAGKWCLSKTAGVSEETGGLWEHNELVIVLIIDEVGLRFVRRGAAIHAGAHLTASLDGSVAVRLHPGQGIHAEMV